MAQFCMTHDLRINLYIFIRIIKTTTKTKTVTSRQTLKVYCLAPHRKCLQISILHKGQKRGFAVFCKHWISSDPLKRRCDVCHLRELGLGEPTCDYPQSETIRSGYRWEVRPVLCRRLGCRDYEDPVTSPEAKRLRRKRCNMEYFLNLGNIS